MFAWDERGTGLALEHGMIKLLRTRDGWALDGADTPEAEKLRELFKTTVIPLPLTPTVSRADALAFARRTPAGQDWG